MAACGRLSLVALTKMINLSSIVYMMPLSFMEEGVSIPKCIIIGNYCLFVSILAGLFRSLYTEGKYMRTMSSVRGFSLNVSYKSFCTERGYIRRGFGGSNTAYQSNKLKFRLNADASKIFKIVI